MDNSISDIESLEYDENLTGRWRPEMFKSDNGGDFENCDNYVDMLDEKRQRIEQQLQRLLRLTPHTYDAIYQRIQGPLLSPIREQTTLSTNNNSTEHISPLMHIRSEPIVLQEPLGIDYEPKSQWQSTETAEEPVIRNPRPFLKRGTGLARFNMTKNDFKKPPPLYQNKEFKSYVKSDRRRTASAPTIRAPPKQTSQANNKKPSVPCGTNRSAIIARPVRQTSTVTRSFDDEVIPTHRSASVACHKVQESPQLPPFKIPKAPMQSLKLKRAVSIETAPLDYREEEKENRIFELLEQRVEESDFCSQNSSVQKLFDKSVVSPPLQPKKLVYHGNVINKAFNANDPKDANEKNKHVDGDSEDLHEHLKTFSEHEMALRVKRKALQDNVKKIFECNYNPRLKTTGRKFVKKVRVKKTVRTPKKENINLCELKARLVELEQEKNAFQRDNNKLKRIQKEILDEKLQLDKRRKEEEKRMREEHDELLRDKEVFLESQKKFIREKIAFEKYCKETKNLPTRDEREEIRRMKDEIEKLKEILNTKEVRFGSTQARLRNQIKVLESENRQLKKDLAEAKTMIVKKVSFDSQAVANSKIINAINQQLGKKIFGSKDQPGVLSAREPAVTKPKPLRRAKSAANLKESQTNVKVDVRRKSKPASTEGSEGEEDLEEPKIINLLGPCLEAMSYSKRSDSADSGVGSRPSASDEYHIERINSTGCLSDDYCSTASHPCLTNNKYSPTTIRCTIIDPKSRVHPMCEQPEEIHEPDVRKVDDCCQVSEPCCNASGLCVAKPRECEPISKRLLPNGDTEEIYSNGKKRLVSGCGDFIRVVYLNGDIREQYLRSLREKYFYKETGVWQTTFTDRPGYQQLDMPDGRTVVYHPDGNVDTLYANGVTARLSLNGTQEWRFKTGEIVRTDANGDKILVFPDGRKEVTSQHFTRLEEIDGTIKTIYKDGRQETKLPNGRVRIKDRHGNVIMDTAGFNTARS